jgi:hypothetical protein
MDKDYNQSIAGELQYAQRLLTFLQDSNGEENIQDYERRKMQDRKAERERIRQEQAVQEVAARTALSTRKVCS